MPAQSAKGAETRGRIIRAAADLFHKQGVRGTSPEEVIEASGTGKGQFYHYFKSKEGLVHEVLQTHLEAIKTGTAPINYEIASWHDLERWFVAHIDLQRRFGMMRGCPFGTVGNELTPNDELVRQDPRSCAIGSRPSSSRRRPPDASPRTRTRSGWPTFASPSSRAPCSWGRSGETANRWRRRSERPWRILGATRSLPPIGPERGRDGGSRPSQRAPGDRAKGQFD